jgi:hypothetical protein
MSGRRDVAQQATRTVRHSRDSGHACGLSKATTLEFTFVRETPSIAIVDSSAPVKSQRFFDRAVMFVHAFCTHSAYFRMKSPHRSHIVSNA